jgi:hypothetical protein
MLENFESFKAIPMGQLNATLSQQLTMRVGIPQRGGHLAVHAFHHDYPTMVSANAFWNSAKGSFQFPQYTDLSELDFALDSAGFTAMRLWQQKGTQKGMAGIFPWTYEQYVELASQFGASWWSQPDLCCEPEIASNQEEVNYRINATATLLEGTLRVVYEWQNELAKRNWSSIAIANALRPPVPVIQGWTASDYLRSLELMVAVWERWQPWLASPSLIGIGSVCRRDLNHPKHGLFAILDALEGQWPKESRAHAFGVKGTCLTELKMMPWIASTDSMAYDFTARVRAHREGISNTYSHRSAEMTKWMDSAHARIKPSAGDQFRLL